MPRWEQIAAKGTHHLFYVLMLVLPLSGWIMSSAGKYPLTWFGLFDVPKFAVERGDAIVDMSRALHGPLGFIFGLLVVLHVGAALRHQFILKDNLLRRMVG
jgi:cytochrome b561